MHTKYDSYHLDRKLQRRVISKDDFTYQTILYFLSKYAKNKLMVLDIGCGVGTTSLYLAAKKVRVTGIDISRLGISIAIKNAVNLNLSEYIKFLILDFPNKLPKGSFDLIICSEVLEHIKDDVDGTKKIYNMLNKNGLVIASSPTQNAPLYKMGLLNNFDRKVGHLRRYTLENYKGLFENAGFKILETKKTEGVFRNFLFTNSFGGFLLHILNKRPFSNIVTFVDNLTVPIFGYSNIYLVGQKR